MTEADSYIDEDEILHSILKKKASELAVRYSELDNDWIDLVEITEELTMTFQEYPNLESEWNDLPLDLQKHLVVSVYEFSPDILSAYINLLRHAGFPKFPTCMRPLKLPVDEAYISLTEVGFEPASIGPISQKFSDKYTSNSDNRMWYDSQAFLFLSRMMFGETVVMECHERMESEFPKFQYSDMARILISWETAKNYPIEWSLNVVESDYNSTDLVEASDDL